MCVCVCVCARARTLCNPRDLPGSAFHGISQARILEWVAISTSGDLPDPGTEPMFPAVAGRFFTTVHM